MAIRRWRRILIALWLLPLTCYAEPKSEVETFLNGYFSSWSMNSMESYAECFHEEAIIHYQDASGKITTQTKTTFLAEQKAYRAKRPAKETAESMDVRFEQSLAHAVVRWKLTQESKVVRGYDHFTLVKQNGKWKILTLLYYPQNKSM